MLVPGAALDRRQSAVARRGHENTALTSASLTCLHSIAFCLLRVGEHPAHRHRASRNREHNRGLPKPIVGTRSQPAGRVDTDPEQHHRPRIRSWGTACTIRVVPARGRRAITLDSPGPLPHPVRLLRLERVQMLDECEDAVVVFTLADVDRRLRKRRAPL